MVLNVKACLFIVVVMLLGGCSQELDSANDMLEWVEEAKYKIANTDFDAIDEYWDQKFADLAEGKSVECELMPSKKGVMDGAQSKKQLICRALKEKSVSICFDNQASSEYLDSVVFNQIECIRHIQNTFSFNSAACDAFDHEKNYFIHYKAECLAYQAKTPELCLQLKNQPVRNSLLKTDEVNSLEVIDCYVDYIRNTKDKSLCSKAQALHENYMKVDKVYRSVKEDSKFFSICNK